MKSASFDWRTAAGRLLGFAGAVVCLTGCATPDRWVDPEEVYRDRPSPEHTPGAEDVRLPKPVHAPPLSPLPVSEEGRLDLTLEQAVVLALRRNRELHAERYNPVIEGTFEQLERGVFDLEVFAEIRLEKETASETSRSTEERFSVEGEDTRSVAGIRQRLPTGTDLELSVEQGRSISDRTPEQQEARVGLSLTQSLLRGFGTPVNLVDIRQAQLGLDASNYELRGFVEALVAETETAYWRFVLAKENLAIFERSLTIARQQLDEVAQRIEVGTLPRNAAAAARAEVARREQASIEAQSAFENRRLRLLRLLNAEDNETFALKVSPLTQPRTETAALTDLEERLALADRMRPDLNEARLRKEQRRLEVVRTRNGLLPKLDLFIDLGKTGYAEAFGDAFSDLDGKNYDLTAGIAFSGHLGNRKDKALDLAARAGREQAEMALENLQNLVQLDVRLAWNEAERARQQISAGAVTRALQEQTLESEQERFAVGSSTPLLVAQAQRDLLASQLAEMEAIVTYRIARVNLYLAEGSLLERRGIQVE